MTGSELELLSELEDELEEEAEELEVLLRPQGAVARKCDNRGIPEIEPVQALGKVACTQYSAHNVADTVGVLKKATGRGIQALDVSTIAPGQNPADNRSAEPKYSDE